MTTYVYETIPQAPGEKSDYLEIKQGMNDLPLDQHPETGVPIRRVILGGFGILSSGRPTTSAPSSGGACCGGSGCCG